MEIAKLNTQSILLTPLQMTDAQSVFELWSDKDAVRFTNWPYLKTFEDCVSRLEKCLKYYENPLHFGAYGIRNGHNNFVGIAGADVVDQAAGKYDVWYFLNRKFWGLGIAKQTVSELLKIMKESGRVKTASATCVTDNTASWKILEHHNFQKTSTLAGGHTKHDQNLDLYEYVLEL